jgi:hypothetical protein
MRMRLWVVLGRERSGSVQYLQSEIRILSGSYQQMIDMW